MKYRLTAAANQDIRDIVQHIRTIQGSPQNAKLVALRLREMFRKLVRAPGIGHVRSELQDDHAESSRFLECLSFMIQMRHP